MGMPDLAIIIVPHPVGGIGEAEVVEKADNMIEELVQLITLSQNGLVYSAGKNEYENDISRLGSARVTVSDSLESVNSFFYDRGWTDGLPIIPPTEYRVKNMLSCIKKRADQVVGKIPPRNGVATFEKIAINAVMAGCLPDFMPIVITAIEAMLEKEFNLYGIQTTTNPVAPLILINGPIIKEVAINSKYNALGQGTKANATIGRAIRLVLLNIGGATPGEIDKATIGQPGKYSLCIAENEEQNPWDPLHLERGFDNSTSTVTVFAAESLSNVNDHNSTDAKGLINTFASAMMSQGTNNILLQRGEILMVISPEHAMTIFNNGLSKEDIKEWIFQKARVPYDSFNKTQQIARFADFETGDLIPVVTAKDKVVVVVAGGAGKHSVFVSTFGDTVSVTKEVMQQ
jgi:hypothetical protein